MKTLSYFLILVCASAMSCSNVSNQPAITLTPQITTLNSGTTTNLNGVFFEDAAKGYIVGDSGTLITTTDGGTTWSKVALSTFKNLNCYFINNSIHFIGGESYFASGSSPTLLTAVTINKKDDIGSAMSFLKVSNMIQCYGYYYMTNSTIGTCLIQNTQNNDWVRPRESYYLQGYLGKPVVLNDSTVLVPTPMSLDLGPIPSVIYRLNTKTWQSDTALQGSSYIGINALSKYNNSSDIVGVGRKEVVYSTDNGSTWTQQATPNNAVLTDVAMTSETNGYACGDGGVLLTTSDGGQTWSVIQSGTTKNLHRIFFPTSTVGYAVGDEGTIIKIDLNGN